MINPLSFTLPMGLSMVYFTLAVPHGWGRWKFSYVFPVAWAIVVSVPALSCKKDERFWCRMPQGCFSIYGFGSPGPTYFTMAPPAPFPYISQQFPLLDILDCSSHTSLQAVYYPYAGAPTLTVLGTHQPPPETNAPIPCLVSSILASQTGVDDWWTWECWHLLESISKSEDLKLPADKSKFPNWEQVFLSKVHSAVWSCDFKCIL
jgi:hypothetical protein